MSLLTRQDLRHHSPFAWACLLALAGTGIGLWLLGRHGAALGTAAALLGCLGLLLPPRERMDILPYRVRALPRRLDATPVLATLLSTPGYGLGWFYRPGPYDEVVHLINGVLAGAVFLAMLRADGRRRSPRRLLWSAAAFGLALAIGWEVFEWLTGLIGDTLDTVTDIALTALGAVLAAAWALRREAATPWVPHLSGPCR